MKKADVFIAYHGTYQETGSIDKARELYYFLESSGVKCYFFPNEQSQYFANTPTIAQGASKFLFVCNPNVSLDSDGKLISNGAFQELTAFWNCIYEGTRQRGDAKVYACDGLTAQDANRMHIAFQGVSHFDESIYSQDECFEQILNWILAPDSNTVPLEKPAKPARTLNDGTSKELKKVFVRRAAMNKSWNLTNMISVAKRVECIGISNNEMTLNMGEEVLRAALDHGTKIELLFLDPDSKYVRMREKEEGQTKYTIRDNTRASLSFIKRVRRNDKTGKPYPNLRIYTYSSLPRMNMIFIDRTHLLLQYYANTVPGASNPCFYIKKQDDGALFDFYYNQYKQIRSKGTLIK